MCVRSTLPPSTRLVFGPLPRSYEPRTIAAILFVRAVTSPSVRGGEGDVIRFLTSMFLSFEIFRGNGGKIDKNRLTSEMHAKQLAGPKFINYVSSACCGFLVPINKGHIAVNKS